MSKNSGYIVEFTNKEGKTQNGIIRYSDQHDALKKYHKSLVRLVDAELNPILDEKGKELVSLKSNDLLKVIGFID